MAINLSSSYESDHEEDDYIDLEVGLHTSNLLSVSVPYPHQQIRNQNSREFEFHMSSNTNEARPPASPADELFYNGKLLPLCPSRPHEELYSTPSLTNTTPTPFESCNVSPSESCRISRELNPEEHLFDISKSKVGESNIYSNEDFIDAHHSPKKSWTRKMRLIKQSSLSSKIKASGAYLKSLFGKSDHSKAAGDELDLKALRDSPNGKPEKPLKVKDQSPSFVQRSCSQVDKKADNINGGHRRSFSVSIKRHSSNKISSSSSSSSSSKNSTKKSDGFSDVQLLKRSGSANSGIESPIQGAIAHCKRSQQHFFSARKPLCEVGFHSFSASRLSISDDQEKLTSLCRG